LGIWADVFFGNGIAVVGKLGIRIKYIGIYINSYE